MTKGIEEIKSRNSAKLNLSMPLMTHFAVCPIFTYRSLCKYVTLIKYLITFLKKLYIYNDVCVCVSVCVCVCVWGGYVHVNVDVLRGQRH